MGDSWIDPNTKDDVECVIYARKFAPGLPKMGYQVVSGTPAEKQKARNYNAQVKASKINTREPAVGRVAIMPYVGDYGHVAGVKSVNPDGTITIREANYEDNKITERTGTPQAFGITGYWSSNA